MRKPNRAVAVTIASLLATIGFILLPVAAQATGTAITEYNIPTAGCTAQDITTGADGNLWFTEQIGGRLGRVTTSGVVTEYAIPGGTDPVGITSGPDGNLWFTQAGANQIGKANVSGTVLNQYPVPTVNSWPTSITPGPDGALWFTEFNSGRIARITTAGAITEYPLPDPTCQPTGIALGPDGALWFTEANADKIGKLVPGTPPAITEYNILTPGGSPQEICSGPDGKMWFTEGAAGRIGRITTTGSIIEYVLPNPACGPVGITAGPDEALWFTETATRKIGRITTQGIRSEFATPDPVLRPNQITLGPDRRLWFTELGVGGTEKIGRAAVTQPTWYLPEGSTAWGYSCYITIENPQTTQVHAEVTYNTAGGAVPGGTFTLPALSKLTVNPADVVGSTDFSTRVNCTEGKTIAVDRTMTWTGGELDKHDEAHNSVGVTDPAYDWYLAEGSSHWGFECWLLIQNPNGVAATCTVTYMIEGEGPQARNHTVPANSRATYNMFDEIGPKDASIEVTSNQPVIPERAMYRYARTEGHDSVGTTLPANDYYLAEGTTAWGFTTYILIQNPNANVVDVTLNYMTDTGSAAPQILTIPAQSRKTVRVNDYLPDRDFSTRVTADLPIIAERAMYWNSGEFEVCHDSIGMSSPHDAFYLPDGQTSEGRETWTLVQNPNTDPVDVEISYLTPDGTGNVTLIETVGAQSRKTFNMLDHSGINGRAAIMVRCVTPRYTIMVERAMYWNSRGVGTETIGAFTE
jgi:streptogramin lyase